MRFAKISSDASPGLGRSQTDDYLPRFSELLPGKDQGTVLPSLSACSDAPHPGWGPSCERVDQQPPVGAQQSDVEGIEASRKPGRRDLAGKSLTVSALSSMPHRREHTEPVALSLARAWRLGTSRAPWPPIRSSLPNGARSSSGGSESPIARISPASFDFPTEVADAADSIEAANLALSTIFIS